jgi:DNA-binding NarL/FixJ family response regulator
MDSQQIRVAIFNENPKSGRDLVKILSKEADISVVAETDLAGIKVVEEQRPDVILIDSKHPFTEELETTEMMVSKFQDTRIIFLSMDSNTNTLTASECLVGACLPLCQDCSTEGILSAIREGHHP